MIPFMVLGMMSEYGLTHDRSISSCYSGKNNKASSCCWPRIWSSAGRGCGNERETASICGLHSTRRKTESQRGRDGYHVGCKTSMQDPCVPAPFIFCVSRQEDFDIAHVM